jgi:menaquinone-dependent protoporphyrinogen oxidase
VNVLVSAASRYGSTTEIAAAIADELRARGLSVAQVPPSDVERLDDYDAVVLGSGVYAGHWLKPARELADMADSLAGRPVWLFSSGPVGDPPKPAENPVDVAAIIAATGAREHRLFAGAITRKRLRFADRAIAAALHVPDGDFRDWDEIRGWAASIAAALTGARSSDLA